jgi:diacylglycerol kinase (ATP)
LEIAKPKMAPVEGPLLLYNPASKNGARIFERARKLLEGGAVAGTNDFRCVPLAELSGARGTPERLVVVGGDGSINAAAEWLLEREHACPLAIVPAGTGNNLARGLGLPLDLEPALRIAFGGAAAAARPLDAVRYSGSNGGRPRLMVQTAALGFPAEIAARYDSIRRNPIGRRLCSPAGPYVYRLLALAGLAAQRRRERRGERLLEVDCVLPDERLRETVFAIFIGNERSLGGNFQPCPRAAVDDGLLDLCFVRAGTGAGYLKLFRSVIRGEHLAMERTVVYRQTRGPVEIELSEPSLLLADGDLWLKDRKFRLEVLPRRFHVITGGARR